MVLKERLFFTVLCLIASFMVLGARSKYLDDQSVTGTEEKVIRSLKKTAQRLVAEKERKKQEKMAIIEQKKQVKMAKIEIKNQKKAKRAERARLEKMARLEKKSLAKKIAQEKDMLRKASLLEVKRRKRIVSWRDYVKTKRAAAVLLKEADALDVSNQLHVEELCREVKRFAKERLDGDLQDYPELEWMARL